MNTVDFGQEHQERPEVIEEALGTVRAAGDKKKNQRRAAASGVAGLTALVLVFGLVSINGNGTKSTAPQQVAITPTTSVTVPTTEIPLSLAAKVTKTAASALVNIKSLSATETASSNDINLPDYVDLPSHSSQAYRIAADGSYWATSAVVVTPEGGSGDNETDTEGYDATTGLYTACYTFKNGDSECDKSHGPQPLNSTLASFNSAVAQASTAANPVAASTTSNGKAIWTLEFDTNPPNSTAKEHVSLTVDQATGFPVHYADTINGKPDAEVTLTNLEINPTFTPSQLVVTAPKGAEIRLEPKSNPNPNQAVTFGSSVPAALKAAYPVSTIDGFTTSEFWSTVHGGEPYVLIPFTVEAQCMPAGATKANVTSLDQQSRRGISSYTIKTIDRSTCAMLPTVYSVTSGGSGAKLLKSFVATDGALKGASFKTYRLNAGPLLMIGQSTKFDVVVAGDLTEDEATDVANGFALQG